MTRYAATKPTNQVENSGTVLLRSGGVEVGITAEDVERGYAVSLAKTNETCAFTMPAGAEEARRWRIRGASSDWIAFDAGGWTFPIGTNSASAFCVDSSGRVDAFAGAVCGQPLASFLPVNAPLGVVPEANWRLLPESARPSRFWHHLTPSNTLQLTWENALLGRAAANPVSFQVELSGTGAFVYRYDLTRVAAPDTNLFASAVFGSSANPAIALFPGSAVPQSRSSVSFYPLYPSDLDDPDPDGDGILTVDEIRIHGTDPHLADTDEDGLSDYDELFVHGTDPLDPHSLGGPGSDGLAARLAGENPFAFPDGSTNTVYEHVFYSGTTNGPVAFPQPTENFAILRVGVSGDGEGDLMVGDRVYPLLPPPRLRSGAATNTLLIAVGRGRRERLWWRRPDGLDVALNSEDFMVGELPSLHPGWIAFPFTDATIPCIHRLSDRSVRVRLVTGFPDMTATWSSGSADVVVTNLPPDAAKITGRFDVDEERAVVYTVWHPDRLAGQTNYTQSVRFCPNKPPPRGESPDVTEGESHHVMCNCSESVSGICRCDCAIYGHEWNMMCDCGDDCAYANPPEMTDDEAAAAGDDYGAAVVLQPLEGVLHLYGDNADQVHLDVPVGAFTNCCPCPEHNRSNFVAAAYSSSRLEVLESNDVFRISYRPCDVTVRGVAPSRSFNDASVCFSTNGGWYIWRDYTVLGLKLDTPGDLPPIEVYNRLSPSLGFPATVTTNEYLAASLILRNDLLLADGVVRVAVENAAGDVRVCFAGCEEYYADPETVLDTAGASERFFPIRHWYRLVRRHDWELGNVRMLVMASEPGAFDLVVEYVGAIGGKSVRDVARQRVTAIRPPLRLDVNRDGSIDDGDSSAWLDGRMFYYWVNEDKFSGDRIDQGLGLVPNTRDLVVNGTFDLINFFPVALDFTPFVDTWGDDVTYIVKPEWNSADSFDYCFANVPWSRAGTIQTTNTITLAGSQLSSAQLTKLTVGGAALSCEMLEDFSDDSGLMICEATSQYVSMRVEIRIGGEVLYSYSVPMYIQSVKRMYDWINARYLSGDNSGRATESHVLWDEEYTKSLIFLHGANVSTSDAENWGDILFKRLWVSGSRARFYNVDWKSDIGSAANYHQNASNAFAVAVNLASVLTSRIPGEKVVMAHSLGNVVASSMINDYGLVVSKYLMCNSAVPAEAYDPDESLRVPQLVHPEWEEYPTNSWASSWHALFINDPDDDRKYLGWPGRFTGVLNVAVNFYSAGDNGGDEVLELAADNDVGILTGITSSLSHHSWHKQELFKGRGIGVGAGATDWSGWNIEENLFGVDKISVAEALQMCDEDFKTNTVFYCYPQSMNSTNISLLVRGAHLALGIPALTSATGVTDLSDILDRENSYNLDLTNPGIGHPNGWPSKSSYPNRWLHSDMKDVSYFFNFKFYEKALEKGGLK